jgi:hypothetical protein
MPPKKKRQKVEPEEEVCMRDKKDAHDEAEMRVLSSIYARLLAAQCGLVSYSMVEWERIHL